ncbi:hypothetical protein Fcan01_22386 [Folsomia candida]|uniref:Uncharacterized protein n=1 Tax=Folsomia candida TaxID=158441 RepID=A0A226DCS3_FOLCA|nr:hypothetical protein Fcan01_22386 [Folsomia candida]
MLSERAISAVHCLLDVGSGLKLFPFDWDPKEKCVKRAGKRHRFYFKIHKFINIAMNIFAAVRLVQALHRGKFPLLFRVLNTVWIFAYTLTTICFVQFDRKEGEILQFVNCLLAYVKRTSKKVLPDCIAQPQLKLPNTNEQRLARLSIQFDILEEKGKPDFVNMSEVDHILTNREIQASRSPSRKSVDTPRWDEVTFLKNEEEDKIDPLCGIRCAFEAVTPLAVAGDVNDKNKEVVAKWKRGVVARRAMSKAKKEAIAYQKSFHAVRCTAGSLYTFENSIVLCCMNNCMQLTLNLFLTFK